MKVWILNYLEYGSVSVYDGMTDVLNIPAVKTELGYLEGGYEDERDQFIADVARAQKAGRGSAEIAERLVIELQEVR